MQSATPIRIPVNPIPACRCSDCISSPWDSHGIYQIGAYSIPSVLSRRGGKVTEPHLRWAVGHNGSQRRGLSVEVPANVASDEDRAWFI